MQKRAACAQKVPMSTAPAKRPPLPAILLANDLLIGDVVFRTRDAWTRDPAEALIAEDAATADLLEAAGKAAFDARQVVDVYLVDISRDSNGVPVPKHFRERFKVLGPSHRPDLGKQAEFPRSGTVPFNASNATAKSA
jgi:Protein of unknown function (DUF2849)